MDFLLCFAIFLSILNFINCSECNIKCDGFKSNLVCGFNTDTKIYKVFTSLCAMNGYSECMKSEFKETPLEECINKQVVKTRRYHESCPTFCPEYYRPVCAVSDRDHRYRTFINGCYLDMINCRGDDESEYTEVPLKYCPNHLMKNIFKERIILYNQPSFTDY